MEHEDAVLEAHLIGGVPILEKIDDDDYEKYKVNIDTVHMNTLKQRFINNPTQIIIDPDSEVLCYEVSTKPNLKDFYKKKVIVVHPMLSFPIWKDQIKCNKCNNDGHENFICKQWCDPRMVNDIDGCVSVLLFQYQCRHCQDKMHAFSTDDNGNFKMKMPDYIRDSYGITFTHKSGYTSRFMQYITKINFLLDVQIGN